jgi:hypothetical protein
LKGEIPMVDLVRNPGQSGRAQQERETDRVFPRNKQSVTRRTGKPARRHFAQQELQQFCGDERGVAREEKDDLGASGFEGRVDPA